MEEKFLAEILDRLSPYPALGAILTTSYLVVRGLLRLLELWLLIRKGDVEAFKRTKYGYEVWKKKSTPNNESEEGQQE